MRNSPLPTPSSSGDYPGNAEYAAAAAATGTGDDSTVEDPETDDEAADSGSDATVGGRSAVATFALVVCGIAAMLA